MKEHELMRIKSDILSHLKTIEYQHKVTIIHAIESGSRSWGFPSPDSDYDVRFVYAHHKDWYLQVIPERDVIELPIDDELDIAGWDIKKAMQLAAKGNVVIHEWLNTPLIYQSRANLFAQLQQMVSGSFQPIKAFHHYRSMAKRAWLDIQETDTIKLKRLFYFLRATLSARWIITHNSMPSVVFQYLLMHSDLEPSMIDDIQALIDLKATQAESAYSRLDQQLIDQAGALFQALPESLSMISQEPAIDWNKNLAKLINQLPPIQA
jgi:predicted nucleotidyltransferase